jgi:hypothetical protein
MKLLNLGRKKKYAPRLVPPSFYRRKPSRHGFNKKFVLPGGINLIKSLPQTSRRDSQSIALSSGESIKNVAAHAWQNS